MTNMKEYLVLAAFLERYEVYVREAELLPFMIATEQGCYPLSNRDYQMLYNLINEYGK